MHQNHQDPIELDLTKPRLAAYKQKWKVHQDTVHWVDVQLAQRKGLKFYQTRSNAVIVYDTLAAYCISKAIVVKSEESYTRKCMCHLDHRRRFPIKIIIWTCDLDSDVARSSKDIQRIELKPNTQSPSTGRPVTKWSVETLERTKFDRATLLIKRHMIMSQTQRVRGDPYGGQESTKRCVLKPKHVGNDQTGTGRPVLVDHKEEHKIDFRVPGLSHAVVKEAEHLRVQELVQRIENHHHRAALHADLQQNSVTNPFSKNSKEMIRELGNVELFELCETTPKVQCSQCLLYWNQGFVYCTCGQCLICSESRRKFNKLRLDAISIPDYAIKKGATHGARHGKTEVQREYHLASNAWKRCCKKVDSQGEHFTGVFTIDFSEIQFIVNHNSQSDGQNKSEKSGMNLQKKTIHTNSLQKKGEDTKDNGILL